MTFVSFDAGLAQAAEHLISADAAGRPGLVLIDGRAGSGKSLFASRLKNEFFQATKFSPRVVQMDDLYPGWEGLAAGSTYLLERILLPLSGGGDAVWQNWDWERGRRGGSDPGNGMRTLEPGAPLIVEGCGAISRESAALASLRIWIAAETEIRRSRFSERDSGAFDEFFGIWSAQEDEFYTEQRSEELADFRIRN